MRAAALLTPFLVLGLLVVMPRLEVWAHRPAAPVRRPRPKVPPAMSSTPSPRADPDSPETPLLRDPPPPPGWVEPLEGSSAEDTQPSTTGWT